MAPRGRAATTLATSPGRAGGAGAGGSGSGGSSVVATGAVAVIGLVAAAVLGRWALRQWKAPAPSPLQVTTVSFPARGAGSVAEEPEDPEAAGGGMMEEVAVPPSIVRSGSSVASSVQSGAAGSAVSPHGTAHAHSNGAAGGPRMPNTFRESIDYLFSEDPVLVEMGVLKVFQMTAHSSTHESLKNCGVIIRLVQLMTSELENIRIPALLALGNLCTDVPSVEEFMLVPVRGYGSVIEFIVARMMREGGPEHGLLLRLIRNASAIDSTGPTLVRNHVVELLIHHAQELPVHDINAQALRVCDGWIALGALNNLACNAAVRDVVCAGVLDLLPALLRCKVIDVRIRTLHLVLNLAQHETSRIRINKSDVPALLAELAEENDTAEQAARVLSVLNGVVSTAEE